MFQISRDQEISRDWRENLLGNINMKLLCEIETVYTLAQFSGAEGSACKNKKSRASLTIGKKNGSQHSEQELFLVVSTIKNIPGLKYKV